MLRFLDGGESHGKALVAVIEGVPSNFIIDMDFINGELARRQKGYGRGKRMGIEKDRVEIWSGLRGTKTTGNPISMIIFNRDYLNWEKILTQEVEEDERIGVARPGHGDFVGFIKYRTGDIRDVIERTSARETAIRTAVGALCKNILKGIGIDIRSKVHSIGNITDEKVDMFDDKIYQVIEQSVVRCYNKQIEERIKEEIDNCRDEGDTVGGCILLSIRGVPAGLGSYTQWDRKLDGILGGAVMSIQGIKAVEIGEALDLSKRGSSFNDEMYFAKGKVIRITNNSGGIEAGVSNGENIELKAFMKPIPSVKKSLKSVDLIRRKNAESRYERSDVCGVIPASIVVENVCAFELLKEMLKKFPADDFDSFKSSINRYVESIKDLLT